jgi:C1A family cysteine protease
MKLAKVRNIKWYGWKPDLPDSRDVYYKAALKSIDKLTIPGHVDLRPKMPSVQNQGSVGSCTGHAAVAIMEHNMIAQSRPYMSLSRLFAYYNARAVEGNAGVDSGATLRDMIKSLAKKGVCSEELWPYDISKLTVKPSKTAYRKAVQNQIRVYARLVDLSDMLLCLAAGFPFMFGFTVYSGFESSDVAETGVLKLPGSAEYPVGGHAVVAVGYDREMKHFLIRNSWGDDWGQRGYFTMPFDYLANRNLSDDFWTVRL